METKLLLLDSLLQEKTSLLAKMPINNWNFFRSVSACNDQKSWLSENPQVEDGREGGNQEFEDGISDQYEDEVNHMMRRLKLNFYRAEDEMFIMKKKQWRREDEEFAREQQRRAKERHERRVRKNRERRLAREEEEMVNRMAEERRQEDGLAVAIRTLLTCGVCGLSLAPPSVIYSCKRGHPLCQQCADAQEAKKCPTEGCDELLAGVDSALEKIAAVVFGWKVETEDGEGPTAPPAEEDDDGRF